MEQLQKCPACGCTDLRDMGWIRGAHVLRCRKCYEWLEMTYRLQLLKKGTMARSAVV